MRLIDSSRDSARAAGTSAEGESLRCVDADRLKQKIRENYRVRGASAYSQDFFKFIEKMIDKEAIEAEPVRHARWLTWEEQFPLEKVPRKNRLGVFCSECHSHADNMSKRCPECGARMDGGAKGDG